jgi:hypothetical protein
VRAKWRFSLRRLAVSVCEDFLVGFVRPDPEPENGARLALNPNRSITTADTNCHDRITSENVLKVKARMARIESEEFVRCPCLLAYIARKRGKHFLEGPVGP